VTNHKNLFCDIKNRKLFQKLHKLVIRLIKMNVKSKRIETIRLIRQKLFIFEFCWLFESLNKRKNRHKNSLFLFHVSKLVAQSELEVVVAWLEFQIEVATGINDVWNLYLSVSIVPVGKRSRFALI